MKRLLDPQPKSPYTFHVIVVDDQTVNAFAVPGGQIVLLRGLVERARTPEELAGHDFAAGSMGPKVEAAARFAASTGRRAAIGSLADIAGIVAGTAGTSVIGQKAADDAGPAS